MGICYHKEQLQGYDDFSQLRIGKSQVDSFIEDQNQVAEGFIFTVKGYSECEYILRNHKKNTQFQHLQKHIMEEHIEQIKKFMIKIEDYEKVSNCIGFQLNKLQIEKVNKQKIEYFDFVVDQNSHRIEGKFVNKQWIPNEQKCIKIFMDKGKMEKIKSKPIVELKSKNYHSKISLQYEVLQNPLVMTKISSIHSELFPQAVGIAYIRLQYIHDYEQQKEHVLQFLQKRIQIIENFKSNTLQQDDSIQYGNNAGSYQSNQKSFHQN